MGKKSRRQMPQAVQEAPSEDITALGARIIGAGVAVIILGFLVLSRADAMGRNWAADLSPLLILGGYVIVGLGIFAPEKFPAKGGGDQKLPPPSPGVCGPE